MLKGKLLWELWVHKTWWDTSSDPASSKMPLSYSSLTTSMVPKLTDGRAA